MCYQVFPPISAFRTSTPYGNQSTHCLLLNVCTVFIVHSALCVLKSQVLSSVIQTLAHFFNVQHKSYFTRSPYLNNAYKLRNKSQTVRMNSIRKDIKLCLFFNSMTRPVNISSAFQWTKEYIQLLMYSSTNCSWPKETKLTDNVWEFILILGCPRANKSMMKYFKVIMRKTPCGQRVGQLWCHSCCSAPRGVWLRLHFSRVHIFHLASPHALSSPSLSL